MAGRREIAHKPEPAVKRHSKAPTATPERFKELAGAIPLKRPAPSPKFIEDER